MRDFRWCNAAAHCTQFFNMNQKVAHIFENMALFLPFFKKNYQNV